MESDPQQRSKPITYWIGEGGGWLLRHVVRGLAATGLTPNMFTFLGLAVNSWAAALFAMGRFRQAAAVLFLAAFLDMADGQVARLVGRVTAFGAFLDSTLDRYADLALYMGLVVHYTLIGRSFYMALAAVAMASSFMVSTGAQGISNLRRISTASNLVLSASHSSIVLKMSKICGWRALAVL